MKSHTNISAVGFLLMTIAAAISGCGSSGSPLGPGAAIPTIEAGGWINGSPTNFADFTGQVTVIEAFASW